MFEEVPRTRRGLAAYLGISRLTARRIVLGPFVVGGGLVLAAVGGSVAVAATVFTASTIRANDLPPRPHPVPLVASASASKPSHHPTRPSPSARPSATTASAAPVPSNAPASSSSQASSHAPTATDSAPSTVTSGSLTTSSTPAPPSSSPGPTATSSPAGNALVYVSGWDDNRKQLMFEFAAVSKGTGPQHSDVYSIASPKQYTATLASDIHIISGGQLCPPAGSSCTVDQLIAGTATGFYAEVGVDPSSAVHSVTERDNISMAAPPVTPSPTPTSTTAFGPAPTSTPTAGTQ